VIITHPSGTCPILHEVVARLSRAGVLTDHLEVPPPRASPEQSQTYFGIGLAPLVLSQGPGDTEVCSKPSAAPRRVFRRIDIKTYPFSQFPYALLSFTGPDCFNRTMRYRAKQMCASLRLLPPPPAPSHTLVLHRSTCTVPGLTCGRAAQGLFGCVRHVLPSLTCARVRAIPYHTPPTVCVPLQAHAVE
jgi:hypothetical protein